MSQTRARTIEQLDLMQSGFERSKVYTKIKDHRLQRKGILVMEASKITEASL